MEFSQNHFPLISPREGWFAAIAVWVLFFGGAIQAQDTSDLALQLRANVVRIEAPNLGNAENGFGFIVGQRSGQIYIVTAQHVIVPNDEPGVTAPTRVKVTFYSDQGKTYDAEVLGTHDTPHDLAVLRLPAPNGLTWIKESLAGAEMQRRGAHVWFIGRNSNWFVPVDPGVINSEHPTDDWRVEIERLPVRPGSSGGPLVARTGIVAMVQRGNEDDSFGLTIDFIKTKVQDWNYPWDLISARAAAQSLTPPTYIPTPSKDRPATQPPIVQPDQPILDNKLKIEWAPHLSPQTMSWAAAQAYCRSLNVADHADWRLPSKSELESMINPELLSANPKTEVVPLYGPFSKTTDGYIFSGTIVPDYNDDPPWIMNIRNGHIFNGKGYEGFTWCVRDIRFTNSR